MAPVFVSFFTPSYATEAAGLVETLDAFGLRHDVRLIADSGDWAWNCGHKPKFLRLRREENPGTPLVWLDADARVRKRPDLFDSLADFDFAAHWRNGEELLSGTLWFNATPAADELLVAWEQECRFFPREWDQKRLEVALFRTPAVRVYRLPAPYTRVFDDPKMGEPVVEHLQASRRLAHRR